MGPPILGLGCVRFGLGQKMGPSTLGLLQNLQKPVRFWFSPVKQWSSQNIKLKGPVRIWFGITIALSNVRRTSPNLVKWGFPLTPLLLYTLFASPDSEPYMWEAALLGYAL